MESNQQIRKTVEEKYKLQLQALIENDTEVKPKNWKMSPKAVRDFILGTKSPLKFKGEEIEVNKKYFGNDQLVERSIISLATNRGLMLIGEPGTAKTMLSELLSASICGISTNTIQGSSATTEDMIKYSFNYAILLDKGPVLEALVKAPLYIGMSEGIITRFEEITRTPAEVQDALISVLSDKVLNIPELNENNLLFANAGFNIIATANTRDRGVNEMSSALKRRFNFETVTPIKDIKLESEVILSQVLDLANENAIAIEPTQDFTTLIATIYNELRNGVSKEGIKINTPSNVMSTADAVAVYYQTMLSSYYYGKKSISIDDLVYNIATTISKENIEDLNILNSYFNTVIKVRASEGDGLWKKIYQKKNLIK